MPIYEYRCQKCGNIFDAFQRIGDDGSDLACPDCGEAKPEKLFSAFASSGGDYSAPSASARSCGSGGFG